MGGGGLRAPSHLQTTERPKLPRTGVLGGPGLGQRVRCAAQGFHSLDLLRGMCEGLLPVPSDPSPEGCRLHQPCSVVRRVPCP